MSGIQTAEVVVLGGGCIGLASAIALAERGTKVTLVERGLPGAANSTLHGGGIRRQFGTELNIRLSQLSAETWDEFAERYGVDPLFRPIGYLFLAHTEEEAATLAAHVRLQNSLGVDSEFLDADEIGRRWPALSGRGFRGAGFRAADGWANQHRIVDGFVRGAIATGVELLAGTEALALELSGGRIAGVATTAGKIAVDAVLVATGPWVKPLLDPLGLSVPVVGRRHELLIVEPAEPLPSGLPWLIGVEDAVHVRSDTKGRALAGASSARIAQSIRIATRGAPMTAGHKPSSILPSVSSGSSAPTRGSGTAGPGSIPARPTDTRSSTSWPKGCSPRWASPAPG